MNYNKIATLFIVHIIILLAGCQKRFYNIDAYERFLLSPSSPIRILKETKDYKISCLFMLPEVILLREYKLWNQNAISKKEMYRNADSLQNKYSNSLCFTLMLQSKCDEDPLLSMYKKDISLINTDNNWTYAKTLKKFQFDFQNSVYLEVNDSKKIEPAVYDFQRSYGMSNVATFFFMFPIERMNGYNFFDSNQHNVVKFALTESSLLTGTEYFEWKLPLELPGRPQELASLFGKNVNCVNFGNHKP